MNISHREFKIFISDSLKHGDRLKLAEMDHIGLSAISQKLNPNLDTPCDIYRGLRQLEKITQINIQAGGQIWQLIKQTAEPWFEARTNLCPVRLLAEVEKEHADVIIAAIKNEPIHIQRQEIFEAIAKLARYAEALGSEDSERASA